jgi:succinoglycan biosynthesis protein ExoA
LQINAMQQHDGFVSILIPTLNEADYVEHAIRSVAPSSAEIDYEILVIDGGSEDGTQSIVERLVRSDRRIRLVPNPPRLQSAAINLGAALADPRAEVIVRADCHANYPKGFVDGLLQTLSTIDAVSVVVPLQTQGLSCFQKAVAAAQNSRIGNGGSRHRSGGGSGFIDHGHHAAFRRSFFESVGGYDVSFSHNEDAELDYRIGREGGRIWFEGTLPITYYPRASAGKLARQYFNHGAGRARTCFKHKLVPRLRQLAPLTATAAVAFGLLAAPFYPAALVLPALYLFACCAAGAVIGLRDRSVCSAFSGIAAGIMHVSWGAGFFWITACHLAQTRPWEHDLHHASVKLTAHDP